MQTLARWTLLCVVASASATGAIAAPEELELSYDVSAVTDYRFRGVSLSDGKPALQGAVTIEHESGLYGSVWSSTIEETSGGESVELDAIAGYRAQPVRGMTLDVAGTYYAYPGDAAANYVEANVGVTIELGRLTPNIGLSYVPRQRATRDSNGRSHPNLYLFGRAEAELQGTPFTLIGSVGYERGYFDLSDEGGKWDWLIGIELMREPLSMSISYLGTDAKLDDASADDCIVGTVSLAF